MFEQHVIDPALCVGCEICLHTCSAGAISELDTRLVIDPEICDNSGRCLDVCPTGAIANWVATVASRPFTIEQQRAWDMLPNAANRVEPSPSRHNAS